MSMDNIELIVNSLPAPTWEKLQMNRSTITDISLCEKVNIKADDNVKVLATQGGCTQSCTSCANTTPTGMGEDVSKLLDGSQIETLKVSANGTSKLVIDFEPEKTQGARIMIEAKKDSEMVVIMDYTGADKDKARTGVIQTLVNLEKGAKLTLVQTIRAGKNTRLLNDIGIKADDMSDFELVQLFVDGGKVYNGCNTALNGKEAVMNCNIGYALAGDDILDLNYVAKHIGQRTESRITAAGSLGGHSQKIFRGTIDFIKGCSAAVGNENEEVLILDDGVVNKTIPLILCAEEDVEGNHGASIGKPDDDILFYLMSRGIDYDKALKLLCIAKLNAAANHIPDNEYREEILAYIQGEEE